jgi:hypothetical protein
VNNKRKKPLKTRLLFLRKNTRIMEGEPVAAPNSGGSSTKDNNLASPEAIDMNGTTANGGEVNSTVKRMT